jgi:hypothetical protein
VLAESLRGKRIRYSAYLRTRGTKAPGGAAIWFRAEDDAGIVVAFQNTESEAVVGDTEWTERFIVIEVPAKASVVFFGAFVSGPGSMWVDDAQIVPVGRDVAVTGSPVAPVALGGRKGKRDLKHMLPAPANLGFEESVDSKNDNAGSPGSE